MPVFNNKHNTTQRKTQRNRNMGGVFLSINVNRATIKSFIIKMDYQVNSHNEKCEKFPLNCGFSASSVFPCFPR